MAFNKKNKSKCPIKINPEIIYLTGYFLSAFLVLTIQFQLLLSYVSTGRTTIILLQISIHISRAFGHQFYNVQENTYSLTLKYFKTGPIFTQKKIIPMGM